MSGDNIVWGTKFGSFVEDVFEFASEIGYEILNIVWGT